MIIQLRKHLFVSVHPFSPDYLFTLSFTFPVYLIILVFLPTPWKTESLVTVSFKCYMYFLWTTHVSIDISQYLFKPFPRLYHKDMLTQLSNSGYKIKKHELSVSTLEEIKQELTVSPFTFSEFDNCVNISLRNNLENSLNINIYMKEIARKRKLLWIVYFTYLL